ncbi:patatin-like phospholipase family protein [Paucibacter sp. PLA-PC-4]|uniref:patatin-like phospholipase family protein n=1 Tax=Paucibacter sp. PLA-PC-4 TaxID=2993655 RepID=UPI00224990BF|nr:patatin-like phospholipase family protein [Paucibacter sp. PLA-PC-4]MCX2862062.1 patatin-like phospholipase family protein [Paucibacter sp. PLA-PC-4]
MNKAFVRAQYLDDLLMRHLHSFLGDIEPDAMALLLEHLQWVELAGGQTLMSQGEPGDAMYLTVSGRLRTYINDEDGRQRMVREISRGQMVGEMSLYTDEPRSATLVAIRDTVLVRLGKAEFRQLLALSGQVSIALTRQIIKRLQTEGARSSMDRPVTIGLLPVSAGVDLGTFASALAEQLRSIGRVAVVDADLLDADLGLPGITHREQGDAEADRSIAVRLDEIEAEHDFVLLLGDATPTSWTYRCSRHCDELYLLADADAPPLIHPIEAECLVRRPPRTDAAEILVLLHPAERLSPAGTAAWLERRPLSDHLHIRPALTRDMARMARLISRTAVGLVLAGGGARGIAHLGVYRALQERGIEIDVVGGTSIGSVMAGYVATDRGFEAVLANARKVFSAKPTSDFNLIPLLSLIKGRRLSGLVETALRELTGQNDVRVEDVWKTYFCVATNYSKASEHIVRRGPMRNAILASIAIPGALPPMIIDGDLMCDGGTFNNFPVDVMRGMRGVGRVIGVDLSFRKPRRINHEEVPGTWALLRDRLRPRAQRRYRLPSLTAFLMNVTVLYSVSRQRQARKLTDVYMNPPLDRVGMLQWKRFEHIVAQGYAHACEVLDGTAPVPAGDD